MHPSGFKRTITDLGPLPSRERFLPLPTFETERLHISSLLPEDAADYLDLIRNPNIQMYMAHDSDGVTVEACKKFFASGQAEGFSFAIKTKVDGRFVGVCGRSKTEVIPGCPDINVYIHPAFWRQGYAREALNEFILYLLIVTHAPGVTARVKRNNDASHRLMESIGMSAVKEHLPTAEIIYHLGREWYLSDIIE